MPARCRLPVPARFGSKRRGVAERSSATWWSGEARRGVAVRSRMRGHDRGMGTAVPEQRRWCLSSSGGGADCFFFDFVMGASPSVVELAVMVPSITVKLNPTPPPQIGGDGHFEPAVIGVLE